MRCFWQRDGEPRLHRIGLVAAATLLTILFVDVDIARAQENATSSSGSQISKALGTIKSIQPDSITVAAESGGEVTANITGTTKILRVPPGEKDLKNATALQMQDLQTGDRVLVRGPAAGNGNGHTIAALSVIVMKQADVAATHQQELDDWQKRGVGGPVTKVDVSTGTITISSGGLGAKKSIAVHVAGSTILRRYAPGSVKFDDAKPAPIDQIKTGDQLLARGSRSADGSEITAEEIVSGTFRSIAGTIKAVDTASDAMTVQDVIAKNAVVVKVSADSQMWKLPAEMAQRFAMRLKGTAGGNGDASSPGAQGQGQGQGQAQGQGIRGGQHPSSADGTARPGTESQTRGSGGNGPPDLQRMLSRLPPIQLKDLQKGDVVYILATEGGNEVIATKLVAGVEAILTAAPNRSATSLLAPWSLGSSAGEGEGSQ